mmetsp:Transcript_23892/g.54378  ORF Transcript_23892/g.54378 Transcript_23892/m.54378 type:complete len:234 (+) Transcript_23892:148-849(+)
MYRRSGIPPALVLFTASHRFATLFSPQPGRAVIISLVVVTSSSLSALLLVSASVLMLALPSLVVSPLLSTLESSSIHEKMSAGPPENSPSRYNCVILPSESPRTSRALRENACTSVAIARGSQHSKRPVQRRICPTVAVAGWSTSSSSSSLLILSSFTSPMLEALCDAPPMNSYAVRDPQAGQKEGASMDIQSFSSSFSSSLSPSMAAIPTTCGITSPARITLTKVPFLTFLV